MHMYRGGDWRVEDMIKDVKEGYLISNMKVPSIDMKRYNWSISCQYAQKIERGEITPAARCDRNGNLNGIF